MELPENGLEHWKAKFIKDLPPLFAERVKKTLRDMQGIVLQMENPWVTKGRGRGNNSRGRGRSSPSSSRSSYGSSSSNTPIIQKGGMSLYNLKL
ncbi:hypothetical protein H5410_060438 [Solanum commersonii]|uniref:Uncharacterized protein n=1 Tax=Solanum commersonii TaxID=4109 RepID=A0A9J5W618_SOLCO|nr:hypothetical protein H5410_060438 [Solanum commersonii]